MTNSKVTLIKLIEKRVDSELSRAAGQCGPSV